MLPGSRCLRRGSYEGHVTPAGQQQARDGSHEGEGGGDTHRRGEPVAECLSRAEASDPGEHRSEDRDPERRAKLAQHVERAGRLADFVGCHRTDDGVLAGGDGRGTKASDDQRRDEFGVREAWPGDQPNPGKRSGLEEQPADYKRPLTEPVDEDTGERGAHEQHGGPGEQSQPSTKRSVAQRGLEELCQEERGAVQRREEQEACRIAR